MLIAKKITIGSVWLFGKKNIIKTLLLSSIVVVLYHFLNLHILAIPFLPVATILTHSIPLKEATEVIYEAIDKRVEELVAGTKYNCKISASFWGDPY